MKEETTIWLSPETLYDEPWSRTNQHIEGNWKRPYEMWGHAEEVLNQFSNNFYLADAITHLKRAVSQRAQYLKKIYCIDEMPFVEKPLKLLERLEHWGLIRPTMLKQLIDVRNAIEHEDAPPPDQKRCLEFLDLVWYFLRSTDQLCTHMPEEFGTDRDRAPRITSLVIDPASHWNIELDCWVYPSMLSATEIPGWLRIEGSQKTGREVALQLKRWKKADKNRVPRVIPYSLLAVCLDEVLLEGCIVGPEDQLRRIIEKYFFTITHEI